MKTICLDIETSPNLGYVWGKWQQDVLEFESEWDLLCWTVKELNGKSLTRGLPDVKNEKQLVKELWEQFDQADIIIAHNGDEFDIKKANTKFTFYNLPPPKPYKTVDTLKIAKKYFSFNSNKLNDLGKYLQLGEKVDTGGFKLWKQCMNGKKKAWRIMMQYNAHDVVLLERIYLKLLPWIQNHPNVNLYSEEFVCPKCGSEDIHHRGYTASKTRFYKRFQCQACGGWSRVIESESRKENLLV